MVFVPKGLQDLAQGFNPGNQPPKRCALKGRQIERAKNVKLGFKRRRIFRSRTPLILAQRFAAGFIW
jgi:hypothetical protein